MLRRAILYGILIVGNKEGFESENRVMKKLTKREINVLCTTLADEYVGLDQDDEVWETVPDFEDYDVSNYGRIYSYRTSKAKLMKGNRLTTQVDAGRHYFCLSNDEGTGMQQAIHWMLLAFEGEPDHEDMVACHNDSIRYNDHLSNARWDTKSADVEDCLKLNRHRQVLTDEEVGLIRSSPLQSNALASLLGVSQTTIKRTRKGAGYKYLNEQYPPTYNHGSTAKPIWMQEVAG